MGEGGTQGGGLLAFECDSEVDASGWRWKIEFE